MEEENDRVIFPLCHRFSSRPTPPTPHPTRLASPLNAQPLLSSLYCLVSSSPHPAVKLHTYHIPTSLHISLLSSPHRRTDLPDFLTACCRRSVPSRTRVDLGCKPTPSKRQRALAKMRQALRTTKQPAPTRPHWRHPPTHTTTACPEPSSTVTRKCRRGGRHAPYPPGPWAHR